MTRSQHDFSFMSLAFAEAEKVKGKTLPNPPVGAVLVRNGKIVGRGGTRPAGQAHAEIVALEKARGHTDGAVLYVTLEPCCHFGKTPPCTKALIRAGVKKVVSACEDPNPKVAGKGFTELRRAGIEVEIGLGRERAEDFYEGFFFWARNGRPKIVAKIGQSLDGKINSSPGIRTDITGPEARRFAHVLRAKCDAILIGGETLRADDPDLTPRLVRGATPEALVLTQGGKLGSKFKLFAKNRSAKTVVLSPGNVLALPKWVEHIRLKNGKKSALAKSLMRIFQDRGYHMVLLEGGRSIWTPFLNSGHCDTLHLLTAPKLMPKGERWDGYLASGWAKTIEFHRFTALGQDYLTEFRRV